MKNKYQTYQKYQNYWLIAIITIVIGFYLYKFHVSAYKETFGNECPTTLIKDGNQILVYNPTLAKIPGVNPIKMDSLDDYEKYIHWQRANNVQCPILYLDKSFNTEITMYDINSSNSGNSSNSSGIDSNGTGVLNHNLPIQDRCLSMNENLNVGQNSNLAENLNLGQNLNSNYEYQYHFQKF